MSEGVEKTIWSSTDHASFFRRISCGHWCGRDYPLILNRQIFCFRKVREEKILPGEEPLPLIFTGEYLEINEFDTLTKQPIVSRKGWRSFTAECFNPKEMKGGESMTFYNSLLSRREVISAVKERRQEIISGAVQVL